jgi:sigma-B regulation protein RsbU (phosphoserine phosphatase)
VNSDAQPVHQLACLEIWGGNRKVAQTVGLPSLAGWIYSMPLGPATGGGDVHYLSVCDREILSRIAVADVAGHGQAVSSLAETLRGLMHKHINIWDQSDFMREVNQAFKRGTSDAGFATVVVLGYFRVNSRLVFTNAGHPPPLWYHAADNRWGLLEDSTPEAESKVGGLPLGLISGTEYRQTAVPLALNDCLMVYTDGFSEAVNEVGQELGQQGLLEVARSLPLDSPAAAGQALLAAVREFRNDSPARDDETLIALQCLPSQPTALE